MVGLPSDVVLAYAWNLMMAKDCGLEPGRIIMNLGDTHIYESHIDKAREYVGTAQHDLPTFEFADSYTDLYNFTKDDIVIKDYVHEDPIKFDLLA